MSKRCKVLHLLSEWKNTGQAKLLVDLCKNMSLEYSTNISNKHNSPLDHLLNENKINSINALQLDKNNFKTLIPDCRKLRDLIKQEKFNIIHCHHTHDLVISILGRCLFRFDAKIVYTSYHRLPLNKSILLRPLFKNVDFYTTFSQNKLNTERRYLGISQNKCKAVMPGLECPKSTDKIERKALGLKDSDFIGVVIMRVQQYRNFSLIIDAVRQIKQKIPSLKIILLGRGTKINELAIEPVKKYALEDTIFALGYKENYQDYLKVSDFLVYTGPGSDGTCRALREAMYLGVASIVVKNSSMDMIATDGGTSIMIEPKPASLGCAIEVLHQDDQLKKKFSENSKDFANNNFNPKKQTMIIEGIYTKLGTRTFLMQR